MTNGIENPDLTRSIEDDDKIQSRENGEIIDLIEYDNDELVHTEPSVILTRMRDMAEIIRNKDRALDEKDSILKEFEKALKDPKATARITEVGSLKADKKYLEDRLQALSYESYHDHEQLISELEEKQAEVLKVARAGKMERDRAQAQITEYQKEIEEKDMTIVKLSAVSKSSALNGTIVSPTKESGFTISRESNHNTKEIISQLEAKITELEDETIQRRIRDMTPTEANLIERAMRAGNENEKLKRQINLLKTDMDELSTTLTIYEGKIQDQEAELERFRLAQRKHVQDMRAAEDKITQFTSREVALLQDKALLNDRVRKLKEDLKDRSKELEESDGRLNRAHNDLADIQTERTRLKNELYHVTHERNILKGRLAQASDWERDKYTNNLASEELKQQLAALKEDMDRVTDKHCFEIKDLEMMTRKKIKEEHKEEKRRRRKVQEELAALRGRDLTSASGTESEQVMTPPALYSVSNTRTVYNKDD